MLEQPHKSNSNHSSQPVPVNEHTSFLPGTENPGKCGLWSYSMDPWFLSEFKNLPGDYIEK